MSYRPRDFYTDQPPRRIFGTETEYQFDTGRSPDPKNEDIAAGMAELGFLVSGQFCSNGAKVYWDAGIEYATPECDSPAAAARADFTGMIIVDKLCHTSQIKKPGLPVLRRAGGFDVETGTTYGRGYHQNLTIPYPKDNEKMEVLKSTLSGFLATRPIWDGAGLVTSKGFLLSQKAPDIGRPVVDGYGRRTEAYYKPLAGLHSSAGGADDKIVGDWGLVEIRSADAHMNLEQSRDSLAIASLVLRLVEQDLINTRNVERFSLLDPIQSLHRVNASRRETKIRSASREQTTALALQRRFADAALAMSEKIDLPAGEKQAAMAYQAKLDTLARYYKSGDLAELILHVEWATKLLVLTRKFGDTAIHDDLDQALKFDAGWHRIDEKSISKRVYQKRAPSPEISEDDILTPPNTRAAARGKAIGSGYCTGASWKYVYIRSDGGRAERHNLVDYWDPDLPAAEPAYSLVSA